MDTSGGQVLLCATALHHTSQPVHLDRASETLAPHLVEFMQAISVVIVSNAERDIEST